MSSGISTSFPVLSLSIGQIAHALLTRPPLIRDRSPFTVRLECVMHAASVHPEPGSNSLKIVIHPRLAPRLNPFQSAILAFFTLLSFSMCFNEIPSHLSCYENSVVQFSKIKFRRSHRASPWQRPSYSITLFLACQAFFQTFFKIFFGLVREIRLCAMPFRAEACIVYHHFSRLSSVFLHFFIFF